MSEANGDMASEESVEEESVIESEANEMSEGDKIKEESAKETNVDAPVVTESKEDEKTEDQVTEMEEEAETDDGRASLDEVRDIPVEVDEVTKSESAVLDTSQDSSPVVSARKKVTIEDQPVESGPADGGSPTRRDPSWWKRSKQDEDELSEAVSIEEQKSEEQAPPEPSSVSAVESVPVEDTKEDSVREDESPKQNEETFVQVPISVEDAPDVKEETKVEVEQPVEETRPAVSPPREHVSRRERAEHEVTQAALQSESAVAAAAFPGSAPLTRASTYVTFPASEYRTNYYSSYGSYIRPSLYHQTEYSTPYTKPTSTYTLSTDMRFGSFGPRSSVSDRLRVRSRSRDRSAYAYSGHYTPAPIRHVRGYSLPPRYAQSTPIGSAAPSRAGSFTSFTDYAGNLTRSASRVSYLATDATIKSPRVAPTAETLNYWYGQQMSRIKNYLRWPKEPPYSYSGNVYGYYPKYSAPRTTYSYPTGYGSSLPRSDLEQRLGTHKTYLRAYELTRLPSMTRSIFW